MRLTAGARLRRASSRGSRPTAVRRAWSRDGRELFYLGRDGRLMAAPFRTGSSVTEGAPLARFAMSPRWSDFDVDSSGHFVAIVTERRSALQPLTIVLNWTAALDR